MLPLLLRSLVLVIGLTVGLKISAEEPVTEGSPLVKSTMETEQLLPLAILAPDGHTASCVTIKLHWNPQLADAGNHDAASFTLDPPSDLFLAQLWAASLAGAVAWQEPWLNAHWQVTLVPNTDGTGLDAALAAGMLVTSARRAYPQNTIIIANLNPDGSLGPVHHLLDRLKAAATSGITRVIIPEAEQTEIEDDNQTVNLVQEAKGRNIEIVTASTLVEATEKAVGDPLPPIQTNGTPPVCSPAVTDVITAAAIKEQDAAEKELSFAPQGGELGLISGTLAERWKAVRAQVSAAQDALHAGHSYTAYLAFAQANARMQALNSAAVRKESDFDLQSALAASEDLRKQFAALLVHPTLDQPDLQSGLVIAEMADWIFGVNAELEGGEMVVKQAYSRRTDATRAEQARARDQLLTAIDEAHYLIGESNFYNSLVPKLDATKSVTVDTQAARYFPELVPVQLALAQTFTEGIRAHALQLGNSLLFDPRLASYIRIMRENKALWDTLQHQQAMSSTVLARNSDASATAAEVTTKVAFDPGVSFAPPRAVVVTAPPKTLTDVALCLSWVNNYCEIAELNQKYLQLKGELDPATHSWHIQDQARLESLLQTADLGAQRGLQFASKVGIDTSILSLIYEHATTLRAQKQDASSLEALRQYWRCALLGDLCWQLAFTPKAVPVDLGTAPPPASPAPNTKSPQVVAPSPGTQKPAVPEAPVALPVLPLESTPTPPTNTPPHSAPEPQVNPVVQPAPVALPVAVAPPPESNAPPVTAPPSNANTDIAPRAEAVDPADLSATPTPPVAPSPVAVPLTNATPVIPTAPLAQPDNTNAAPAQP